MRVARLLAAMVVALPVAASPGADTLESGALARAVADALTARHLDAFAAPDPGAPGRFVAALVYPGVQLLVVSARYATPAALQPLIDAGRYRDVYMTLQTGSVPESRLFVHDMQADGLRADAKQTPDIVYERLTDETIFGGDPREKSYRQTLEAKDALYSRALRVLADALAIGADAAGSVASGRQGP
jgi:hypothetical protein